MIRFDLTRSFNSQKSHVNAFSVSFKFKKYSDRLLKILREMLVYYVTKINTKYYRKGQWHKNCYFYIYGDYTDDNLMKTGNDTDPK